jgi:hypothetical protein
MAPMYCGSVLGGSPSGPGRKLAVLIYRMLKYGTQYVDEGMEHYEAKYQATNVQYLRAQAAKLGMVLLPKQPAVAGALT